MIKFNFADISSAFTDWSFQHGLSIVAICIFALTFEYAGGIFFEKLIRKIITSKNFRTEEAERKREDTLIRIVRGTIKVGVWIVALLMILSELGIEIGPLLAAAGVAGLAIGFGGQYLIRDVVAGLFIILENQYRIGDVVCLDGTCGLVEDISIRVATLRDLDGVVHNVPHGVVAKVSNLSKEFARVNLDIGISYNADIEKVIAVVDRAGAEMAEDPVWKTDILKPIHFERLDSFGDSAMVIKILGDTKPLRQWAVAGEFRKRIKIAFDKAGIEIPFPQRVVHTIK
ncbi:MAG: mechanosensitive ion channel family protein [Candidatus Pacebacteria bacterium]|nr:mechanosensitive ion channel family protein [Candidatus Paceibacterota bacterium]MCF7857141.1 mechanosensitive ion channel family protein [Candidatus Paceibacterota bacterium]